MASKEAVPSIVEAGSLGQLVCEALVKGQVDEATSYRLAQFFETVPLFRVCIVASGKFILASDNLVGAGRKLMRLLPYAGSVAGIAIFCNQSCHAVCSGRAHSMATDLKLATTEHGCPAIACVPVPRVGALTIGLSDTNNVPRSTWAKLQLLAAAMSGHLAEGASRMLQDIHANFMLRGDPRCPCSLCHGNDRQQGYEEDGFEESDMGGESSDESSDDCVKWNAGAVSGAVCSSFPPQLQRQRSNTTASSSSSCTAASTRQDEDVAKSHRSRVPSRQAAVKAATLLLSGGRSKSLRRVPTPTSGETPPSGETSPRLSGDDPAHPGASSRRAVQRTVAAKSRQSGGRIMSATQAGIRKASGTPGKIVGRSEVARVHARLQCSTHE